MAAEVPTGLVELSLWCAGRTMLDGAFPGQCWHAFIPAADATAQLATRSAYSVDSHHMPGTIGDVALLHIRWPLTQECPPAFSGRHCGLGPLTTAEAPWHECQQRQAIRCVLPLPRRRHQAGNLGVEHARPDAVQRALATARLSQPERKEFDREDLVALGLFTPMGAAQAEAQVNTCCVKCAMSFRSCRWILHMTCKLLWCQALCPSSIQLHVLSTASRGEEC